MNRAMRLYFQKGPDAFAPFLGFEEINSSELLFGVYGLDRKAPSLTVRFSDREVTDEELLDLQWEYKAARQMRAPADHFTCHQDGTFHLKAHRSVQPLYSDRLRRAEPLDPKTSRFLDFLVLSDRVEEYRCVVRHPKRPAIRIVAEPRAVVFIRGRFSGLEYNLEKEAEQETARIRGAPHTVLAHTVSWSTMKAVLMIQKQYPPSEVFQNRPRGTLVLFRFNVSEHRHLIKAFGFS